MAQALSVGPRLTAAFSTRGTQLVHQGSATWQAHELPSVSSLLEERAIGRQDRSVPYGADVGRADLSSGSPLQLREQWEQDHWENRQCLPFPFPSMRAKPRAEEREGSLLPFCGSPASPLLLRQDTDRSTSTSSSVSSVSSTFARHLSAKRETLASGWQSELSPLCHTDLSSQMPPGGLCTVGIEQGRDEPSEEEILTDDEEDAYEEVHAPCLNFEEVEEFCRGLNKDKRVIEGITILPLETRVSRATGEVHVAYALHVAQEEMPCVPGSPALQALLPKFFQGQ